MTGAGNSILVPLESQELLTSAQTRREEPVSVGIPLPRGLVSTEAGLALRDGDGGLRPLQVRILDRWADGSARWALLDFTLNTDTGRPQALVLAAGPRSSTEPTRD